MIENITDNFNKINLDSKDIDKLIKIQKRFRGCIFRLKTITLCIK